MLDLDTLDVLTPATLALGVVVSTLLLFCFCSGGSDDATCRRERDEDVRCYSMSKRDFKLAELVQYDGSNVSAPIALALKGKVFNVSSAYGMYGDGGCYQSLAGRDASRMLAKGILEEESAEEAAVPLSAQEEETLRLWGEHYDFKYEYVGRLLDGQYPDGQTEQGTQHISSVGDARSSGLVACLSGCLPSRGNRGWPPQPTL
mmetsp:Transcript_41982/g.89635  ORF Transcript_41982/g.89635 Transcript_41982/m.89635 type:complete len:203 (-) Transcript_41982:274-882(-)